MATTGAKTDTFENLLLDHLFRGTAAPGTGLYIGLVTGDPTVNDVSAGTWHSSYEVGVDKGYTRQDLSVHNNLMMQAAVTGVMTMTGEINFGTSTGASEAAALWGDVTGFFISTASGNGVAPGTTYYYGIFDTAKNVATGDSVRITAGNLTIEER